MSAEFAIAAALGKFKLKKIIYQKKIFLISFLWIFKYSFLNCEEQEVKRYLVLFFNASLIKNVKKSCWFLYGFNLIV